MLVRTWWKVHELSGVAIGADEAAKFKSEAQDKHYITKINELQKDIADLKQKLQPKAEDPKSEEKRGMTYIEYRLRMIENENKTTK